MKKNNLISLCLLLFLGTYCSIALGQNSSALSNTNTAPYIDISPSPPDSFLFEAVNMPVLSGPAAFYSYLWWMGDNGFSFAPSPTYAFNPLFLNRPLTVSMVATGNYSTGGPPPLHKPYSPPNVGNRPLDLFVNSSNNLLVQNYRNAVIGDIMYLIVSYKVPNSFNPNSSGGLYSGTISLDMSPHSSVVIGSNGGNNSFLPNGEIYSSQNTSWTFGDLKYGDVRSILIPIEIKPNEEEHLYFNVRLDFENHPMDENQFGINYFPLETTVAESHDPNQMISHSEALNDCDYGGKPINYTVQFQNVGEYQTDYVKVVCLLDEKLDLNTIDPSSIKVPAVYNGNNSARAIQGRTQGLFRSNYFIDPSTHSITFEFNGLVLLSPNDINCRNINMTKEEVSFSIDLLPNYRFGPEVVSRAEITFDDNDVIETNETIVTCADPISEADGGGFYDQDPDLTPADPLNKYLLIGALVVITGIAVFLKRKQK